MKPIQLLVFFIIHASSYHTYATREFLNGTNYKCNEDGNLIELPNHLKKPCILCICSKGFVKCEKLNHCQGNRPDRKRRSIRCIEEECCDVVEDVFLKNVDGSNRLVTYRTFEDNNISEINNQIRTSTIRYVHCPNDLMRTNQMNNKFGELLNEKSNSQSRSVINTRSVTRSLPNNDNPPVCTLSNRLNLDTNKYRQYITTFDDFKMRLRYKDHCHFVFARDCSKEQSFTIHLLYSSNHLNKSFNLNKSNQKLPFDKFSEIVNLKASNELDGKSTSNYTQRYLTTLEQKKNSNQIKLGLFIRIGNRKIRLDGLNVKLNNQPILLPYVHRGIKIVYYQHHIIIKSDIGLKLVWSGQELVVYLPNLFQGSTCGLCGNFNGDLTDDLKDRKKQPVQSQLRFIQSWMTGKNRQCLMNGKHHKSKSNSNLKIKENKLVKNDFPFNSTCKYTFKRKMKATRFCNSLKLDLPLECIQSLGINNYYEDCLDQMCPCNRRSCNCQILSSYVDKCLKVLENKINQFNRFNMTIFRKECLNNNHLLGSIINPGNQQGNSNQSRTARTLDLLNSDRHFESDKLSKSCPSGSVYSQCAIDKVTCSDLAPKSDFNNRSTKHLIHDNICRPGCKCESFMVWTDDLSKCIHIDKCPSLSLNLRKLRSSNSPLKRPKLN